MAALAFFSEGRRAPFVDDAVTAGADMLRGLAMPASIAALRLMGSWTVTVVHTTVDDPMTANVNKPKTAAGDAHVFAYIASMPQPQRAMAVRIDALAAEAGSREAICEPQQAMTCGAFAPT